MANNTVNPKSAALALSAQIKGSHVREEPSSYRGLLYIPVKVGTRSPATVYEASRGEFEGDVEVIVAFDSRADAKPFVGEAQSKIAAYARDHALKAAVDPGDSNKRGFKMTCSQVIAALEARTPSRAPLASISGPTLSVESAMRQADIEAAMAQVDEEAKPSPRDSAVALIKAAKAARGEEATEEYISKVLSKMGL